MRRSVALAILAPVAGLLFLGHLVTVTPMNVYAGQGLPTPTPTASCSADSSGPGCGAGGTTSSATASSGTGGDCTWKEGGNSVVGIYGATAPPQSEWTWLDDAEYDAVVAWMANHVVIGLGTTPYTSMGVVFCPDPTVAGVFSIGTLTRPRRQPTCSGCGRSRRLRGTHRVSALRPRWERPRW